MGLRGVPWPSRGVPWPPRGVPWPLYEEYGLEDPYYIYLHRFSENVPPLTCYNFDTHSSITVIFGKNVTEKVGN